MTVYIENETGIQFAFDYEEVIRKVIEQALETEGCPYDAQVNVILTDDESIRVINHDERGIDNATDVLSFPMAFYDIPADFDGLETQDDVFDPDTGEYILGDIVISLEHVRDQAKAYGHSEKRELAFLVAHSMLHLMGYDHIENAERIRMEEKQEAVLEALLITREAE